MSAPNTPSTGPIMLTKNIAEFARLTQQHAAADLLVQGTYYDAETGRGCFIGCFAHGDNPEVLAEEEAVLEVYKEAMGMA